MHCLVRRRLFRALLLPRTPSSPISTLVQGPTESIKDRASNGLLHRGPLSSPWSATQTRFKFVGADVRTGNIIEKNGRLYQVLKATHTQQGRGRASIQVELRDVDTGNKSTQRFRTDESIERVFVEEKSLAVLYQDGDNVVLMEPNTFEQVEVPKELFGNASVYLAEDLPVTLLSADGKVMSVSIPTKVTCTVVEAPPHTKGTSVNPHYKKVKLDNGLSISVPPFIDTGHKILVNTEENSYVSRVS